MSGEVGKSEYQTQHRVIGLFHDELGYRFLGDWSDLDSHVAAGTRVETVQLINWSGVGATRPLRGSYTAPLRFVVKLKPGNQH